MLLIMSNLLVNKSDELFTTALFLNSVVPSLCDEQFKSEEGVRISLLDTNG